jgi:MFS superfamily sulfate permease-like transporter
LPGTDKYRDITVHPKAEILPGLLIFRFDAPIIFANANYFTNEVRRLIGESKIPVRTILLPSHQINQLDSSGANQLDRLQAELGAEGIRLSFAEAKNALRETMRHTGLEEKIGVENFYESIEDGVKAFLQRSDQQTDQVVKG